MRFLFLAALTACGETPVDTTVTAGVACVDSGIATVTYTFDTCLSSSCDTLVSSSCSATVEGEVVTIVGEAVIQSVGNECTDDCGRATATCTMPALPDTGEITVIVDGAAAIPLADFVCATGE
jgi:hypothetical protein